MSRKLVMEYDGRLHYVYGSFNQTNNFNCKLWITIVELTSPEPCLVHDGFTILVNYLEPAYWARLFRCLMFCPKLEQSTAVFMC